MDKQSELSFPTIYIPTFIFYKTKTVDNGMPLSFDLDLDV